MNEQGFDAGAGSSQAPASEAGQEQLPTGGNTTETQATEPAWWEGKNFDEAPQFRTLKQTFDTRLDQTTKAYQTAQQQAQQTAYQLAQLQRQVEEQSLAGKDDYEKLQHFYTKEKQRAEAAEAQLQAVQMEIGRQKYVSAIRDEFGIDLSNKQFNTPDEAMLMVAKMQREKAAELEKQVGALTKKAGAIAAADAEKPDLGGGAPAMGSHALQRQFNEAMINSQSEAADKVARQAIREGVTLNRSEWLAQRKRD